DHGDLWGRPLELTRVTETDLTVVYATDQFRFTRELQLNGNGLLANYIVENRCAEPLPYLWALHALFWVTDRDRIVLPGVDHVRATSMSLAGATIAGNRIAWPDPGEALPFRLDAIQPLTRGFAGKFFADG